MKENTIIRLIKLYKIVINKYRSQVLAGFKQYCTYVKKYGIKTKVIMCPGGMGDVYVCCRNCLPSLASENDEYIPVFVVLREASVEISKMFGIENIELLPYKERKKLLNMAMFDSFSLAHLDVISPMMLALHYQIFTSMEGIHGNTEMDHFRYSSEKYWKYNVYPIFNEFNRLDYPCISKGKTVLLIPYSVSMEEIDIHFWEKMATRIQDKGFKVITNVKGENESAINGTEAVKIPLNILVPFVEECGNVIGVRSGILDVMEMADAKMIILYPKVKNGPRAYGRTSYDSWESFSWNKWFKKNSALEMSYYDEFQDFIIEKTMEYLGNGN